MVRLSYDIFLIFFLLEGDGMALVSWIHGNSTACLSVEAGKAIGDSGGERITGIESGGTRMEMVQLAKVIQHTYQWFSIFQPWF